MIGSRIICMMKNMRHHRATALVVLLAALAVSTQTGAARDRLVAASPAGVEMNSGLVQSALKNDVPLQPQGALPSQSASSTIFRDIPSISGRYSLGGRTIMPYVGAGFGGGYASELNRSLGGAPPTPTDSGLRSQFGQGFSPNEFQMGVRIPF